MSLWSTYITRTRLNGEFVSAREQKKLSQLIRRNHSLSNFSLKKDNTHNIKDNYLINRVFEVLFFYSPNGHVSYYRNNIVGDSIDTVSRIGNSDTV